MALRGRPAQPVHLVQRARLAQLAPRVQPDLRVLQGRLDLVARRDRVARKVKDFRLMLLLRSSPIFLSLRLKALARHTSLAKTTISISGMEQIGLMLAA